MKETVMNKEIILDVTDSGEIKIETQGFKGKSCIAESAFLEGVLGKEISTQLTPAYFEFTGESVVKKHLNLCG